MINPNIIESKFLRSRLTTNKTYLWKDVNEDTAKQILSLVELQDAESIILLFYDSKMKFWVLTNLRLITSEEPIVLQDIHRVDIIDILESHENKMNGNHINIYLKNGERTILEVEVGTWHVMYSILKFIIMHNDTESR